MSVGEKHNYLALSIRKKVKINRRSNETGG